MSKKRLGKGLQALIPEIEETPLSDAVDVELEDIIVNEGQPRKIFDEKKLAELTSSVAQHGVLQPLIVRPRGEKYELVAGERRLRAAKKAGLKKVPVVVKVLTDRETLEIALIENLQREDLNPLEEAEAYKKLLEEFNYTQEQLAKEWEKPLGRCQYFKAAFFTPGCKEGNRERAPDRGTCPGPAGPAS